MPSRTFTDEKASSGASVKLRVMVAGDWSTTAPAPGSDARSTPWAWATGAGPRASPAATARATSAALAVVRRVERDTG